MLKSSIKYSFLCGLFLTILFWVSIKLGSNPLLEIRHFFFDLVIFFLFIYFAEREYKQYQNNGYLHFWQGMSIAFIVYLPASIIFSICLTLIFYMDATILEGYQQGALAFMESKKDALLEGISQQEFEKRKSDVLDVTAYDLVLSSGLKKVVAGFFVTPIASILLRKKPN